MILKVVIVRLLRRNYPEFRVGPECNDWHPWKKRRWVKIKTDENDVSTVSQSRVGSRRYKLEDRHRWFSLSTHRRNQNRWYPDFRLVLLKGERPPFCCFCYPVQLLRAPRIYSSHERFLLQQLPEKRTGDEESKKQCKAQMMHSTLEANHVVCGGWETQEKSALVFL